MIKENEKEIALQISSKLEYLIKTKRVKAKEIADFIGIAKENFSRGRNLLKKGKLPPSYFLIGIALFFNENFLKINLWNSEPKTKSHLSKKWKMILVY